jgi:sialate O-acetylesterase
MRRICSLAAILVVGLAATAWADVKLPPFFSDHMVLQRETKAPIWGTAAPGEKVTVKFRDQEQQVTADAAGNWRAELAGLKAGGPDELTVSGTNTVKFSDVLVGEVWVGSGQSNMAGNVGGYAKGDTVLAELAAKEFPKIRGCSARGAWKVATPQNNPSFSAILFAFAVRLHEGIDMPVGMMLGAVGGTPSGAWLSEEALASDPACQKQISEYATTYDTVLKDYEARIVPAWEKAVADAKAANKPAPNKPQAPGKPGTANGQPAGYLYKAHIQPLVGYGIRGVLWDQGESRTAIGGVDQYTLMGALIRGWRKEWNAGDFAFIYVQKPSGGGPAWDKNNPVTSHAEEFAPQPAGQPGKLPTTYGSDGGYVDNHVRIMKYPNVGMAISTDLGAGIHPANKSGYGSRAATVALGMTYGKPVEYYGPIYAGHEIEAGKVRIKFTHVGKGLAIAHSEKLQGFVIAGDDQNFVWADAVIDGDAVVVSSPQVPKPAAVRYAWSGRHPWANLFNKDGLPAVTFRTDAW